MMGIKSERLGSVQVIAIVIGLIICLGGALWWKGRATQTQELRTLYAFAAGGDKASLKRLSEYPSQDAILLLEKLALDRNVFAESRMAAINKLGDKPSWDRSILEPLLRIDQPFVVRHAAAEVLEMHGCEDSCLAATLRALHAIWKGEPAIESARSTEELEQGYGVHIPSDEKAKVNAGLLDKTQGDYLKLLNLNACSARHALQRDYSSEPAFVDKVQSKLGPC